MLQRDQLAAIVDAFPDAVYVRDLDGQVLFFNAAAAKLADVSPAEAVGRHCTSLFGDGSTSCAEDCPADQAAHSADSYVQYDHQLQVCGHNYWMEVVAYPLLDGGQPVGSVVVLHDATLRRQAEAQSERALQHFREVSGNALVWFWETDAQGMYTYASSSLYNVLGYEPEEVVGKKFFYDLFHPEDGGETMKSALEGFALKQPFAEFVNHNVHKDGRSVWLATSGVPKTDERGNLLGYRGADSDITGRIPPASG